MNSTEKSSVRLELRRHLQIALSVALFTATASVRASIATDDSSHMLAQSLVGSDGSSEDSETLLLELPSPAPTGTTPLLTPNLLASLSPKRIRAASWPVRIGLPQAEPSEWQEMTEAIDAFFSFDSKERLSFYRLNGNRNVSDFSPSLRANVIQGSRSQLEIGVRGMMIFLPKNGVSAQTLSEVTLWRETMSRAGWEVRWRWYGSHSERRNRSVFISLNGVKAGTLAPSMVLGGVSIRFLGKNRPKSRF